MPYLKADFFAAIAAAAASRAVSAEAYQAGDPRTLWNLEASAAMLAMLSYQVDVAEVEPFVMARAGTVLAAASLRGVLPLGKAGSVQVQVQNLAAVPVTIASGRVLRDGRGRPYSTTSTATVAAGATATITAQQATTRTFTHSVAVSAPFYSLEITPPEDATYMTGFDIADGFGAFSYTPEFANVAPGDRVFHVETDEYKRLFARFGASDANGAVVGHQPAAGDVLTITVRECSGRLDLDLGAAFALDFVGTADEALQRLTLLAVDAPGANPPELDVLRMLARYPALHDGSAVFLSDFDFLLRRSLAGVEFLSVWNEQVEERARGANVTNINTLFVSYLIPAATALASETLIRQIIARADSSYRVQFVALRAVPLVVTVNANVAVVHDVGQVQSQIRAALISRYGPATVAASRGGQTLLRIQQVQKELIEDVPALQDQVSDFSVVVTPPASTLPEDYRYISSATLNVVVQRITDATGLWSQ